MASARAIGSRLRCVNCQHQILRCFLSDFVTTSSLVVSRATTTQPRSSRVAFHSRSPLWEREQQTEPEVTASRLVDDSHGGALPAQDESIQTSPVPWYLQHQSQSVKPETNPFAERQRLPDLPPNPPSILHPLMKYISVELGLDYLTVLDLRKLDPPPALGANLLMVIGTARSEKHLNVSADRLCRMLRTEYKLSPQPDGLLGRNELKLKLRRKNRRSKMLGAVGAKDRSDMDDGLRTGWVCVNVGEIDDGQQSLPERTDVRDDGFVGFGSGGHGTKIVVQMLTEERRVEVDLEGLWQGALDLAAKKAQRERERIEKSDLNDESIPASPSRVPELGSPRSPPTLLSQRPRGLSTSQIRELHTSTTLRSTEQSLASPFAKAFPSNMRSHPRSAPPSASVTPAEKAQALRNQLSNLTRLSDPVALDALGQGEEDRTSTSFLANFYDSWPTFPDAEHYDCLIELQCFALRKQHPGYTKGVLMRQLTQMQAEAWETSEHTFLEAFETILLTPYSLSDGAQKKRGGLDGLHAFRKDLGRAFDVLEMMEFHGYDMLQDAIFLTLHRAVCNPALLTTEPFVRDEDASKRMRMFKKDCITHQNHLRKVMRQLYQPWSDQVYLEMLHSYGQQREWNGFWETWRELPKQLRPRSPQMYALMFRAVAAQGHETHCQNALRENFEGMKGEIPLVEMKGDVAAAVLDCLIAAKVQEDDPSWSLMWEECRRASPEVFIESTPLRERIDVN